MKQKNIMKNKILMIMIFGIMVSMSFAIAQELTCYDSDGVNINNKGYIQLSLGDWEDEKQYDYCANPQQVAEYTCDGSDVVVTTYACPFGCGDGKCKTQDDPTPGCTSEGNPCLFADVQCCEGLQCIDYQCQKPKKSGYNIPLIIGGIGLIGYALFSGNKKRGKKK